VGRAKGISLMGDNLEKFFPRLEGASYAITSPATPNYNCIGWAAGDDSRWWEPDTFELYFWPEAVPRRYTLQAYAEAFRREGFELCENATFEAGWEKVAIYTKEDGSPTHAARQLTNGDWTSKLGSAEDIRHADLDHLNGEHYGKPAIMLRRQRHGEALSSD
jgi:hypothetical protein